MIRGFFDANFAVPVPKVRAAVFLPGSNTNWAPVDFLLDTGASVTCLHPVDALFSIGWSAAQLARPQYWTVHEQVGGVGGSALYYIVQASYALQRTDATWWTFDGQIRVAQLRADNQNLASLLGWDVLQHFQIVTDWPNRQITLTP